MSYGRKQITLLRYRDPRKDLRSKGLWGEGENLAFITAVLPARLPDKPQDFRRGASDRNRTNDTGIFSPLLYRLSYRGITGAFVPAPSRILINRGPRKDLRSRGLWGRGGISAFAAAVLRAGLPGKPLTFRRATRIGLEPTTPSVTGWCSNQLSYRATWWKLTGSNR